MVYLSKFIFELVWIRNVYILDHILLKSKNRIEQRTRKCNRAVKNKLVTKINYYSIKPLVKLLLLQ